MILIPPQKMRVEHLGGGKYGPFQKNCNMSVETHGREMGSDPFCAQHPSGRSGKRGLTPFPPWIAHSVLQFFWNGP
jgi:hypothetical protein